MFDRFASRHLRARRVLIVALALAGTEIFGADVLQEAVDATLKMNNEAQRSQDKIDTLAEERRNFLEEYRLITRQIDTLNVYNGHLQKLIDSQHAEHAALEEQIQEIDVTHREIVPLILRMTDSLAHFVTLDVPFLPDERSRRIAQLQTLLDRADVTVSEKYRRVLEGYQIENEYGHTIEAYRGPLETPEVSRTVDFLRIGRVVLIYQTLDGTESGYWDHDTRQWLALPEDYRFAINQGLRIARKQAAPDLLRLPVPAPRAVP